jgi:hypothetical protein
MKKHLGMLWILLALVVLITVPAAAAKPTTVSGEMIAFGPIIPPFPQQETRGDNCIITLRFWREWGGSFRGKDASDVRIIVHAPCDEGGPNLHRENIKWRGTYTGDLCLGGTWEENDCVGGELYSGSFDFVGQQQVTPAPAPEQTFKAKFVILQGYDGFAGLHGVLDFWGRAGTIDGWGAYEGQVHVDPS